MQFANSNAAKPKPMEYPNYIAIFKYDQNETSVLNFELWDTVPVNYMICNLI